MARTKQTRTVRNTDTTARHLWLAGLGLAVIARRQGVAAADALARRASGARRQAADAVVDSRNSLTDAALALRAQVEAGAGDAFGRIESAVAPLVERFGRGKSRRATRRTRKPTAKKKAARRAPAARQGSKPARRSRKA